MGCYVNPKTETKEQFLQREGLELPFQLGINCGFEEIIKTTPEKLPVVWVDNGSFTAAGVCFNESEFEAFTKPNEERQREMFLVPIEKLKEVSDVEDWLGLAAKV